MNELEKANDKVLMKNNLLIQAKYSLTLAENKIFTLILYKLQKDNRGIYSCSITQDEFKYILKKTKSTTISGIREILDKLKHKDIFIKEVDKNIWHDYTLIGGFSFDENNKTFHIEALPKIYDLLKDYYSNGYTPINLFVTLGMNNYYGQRLYDLLRLWSGTKNTINYKVDYLKECLQLTNKYPNFKDFKRRVILPAIKELNDTGYFEIDIKEIKVGRKVDSIDFIVKDLDKRKYFIKDEVAVASDKVICDIKEEISIKTNIITNQNSEKIDLNTPQSDLFIPDEEIFTKGTLRSLKKDFKEIDFKNKYMERAFDDAIMITLDRDDVENIKATSYKFFKSTLDNKIIEYRLEEQEEINHKKEMDMHW
ncbi:MAG: replication initiation protein [Paraclostridium sp.]